jgi:hypothetical protein
MPLSRFILLAQSERNYSNFAFSPHNKKAGNRQKYKESMKWSILRKYNFIYTYV